MWLENTLDLTTILIGLLVALLILWTYKKKYPRNLPPGPAGLPLLGYAPFLGANPSVSLMKLKKKYGPIMSVKIGQKNWIVLNDYDTIHEALVRQGEIYSGRPNLYFFEILSGGHGIIMNDNLTTWKTLRKFGLTTLRGFGVGKKSLEVHILEEARDLLQQLTADKTRDFKHIVTIAVSNVVSRIVFGQRCEYDDNDLQTLLRIMEEFFSDNLDTKLMGAMTFTPVLRHLPVFRSTWKLFLEEMEVMRGVLKKFLDKHRASYSEGDMRDFVDAFLKRMDSTGADDQDFNEMNLLHSIRDLYEAGTETTSNTLCWAIFTFCHFPDSQEKMANEVRSVIGENGTPSVDHRDQMPYTCAFILEIMRVKTVAPLSVFHKTAEDSVLNGYTIPKNSMIVPNLWAVHHDPDLFHEPDQFRPERYFDCNGNFVKSNHVIPFSLGPRHCLGEQLAKMEVFLVLTSLVQKLKIIPDPDYELPDYVSAGQSSGFTFGAPDFKVIFQKI